MTLTRAPSDARQGAARAANRFRRAVGQWEWVWTLEAGAETGMVHLHGVVRAPYIPQALLARQAVEAGWGEVAWIASGVNSAGSYASKAAGYASKGYLAYEGWRALNGGTKPWHWSRQYTRGVPMREWVPPLTPGSDPGPWRVVWAHEVEGYAERLATAEAEREAAAWSNFPTVVERAEEDRQLRHAAGFVRDWLGAVDADAARKLARSC